MHCKYTIIEFISANGHSNNYNSWVLITRPPHLEISASQTSYLIIHVCGTCSQTTWSLRENCACAVCCTQSIQGQYGLHMFDVLRAEQDDGILHCNRSGIRKCCNNYFDMYKCELLM